jgi:hypothetical protein
VIFEDEASFWLDGTLHRTWARVGAGPKVDTYGQRKTAHVFGAIALEDAKMRYMFASVFNGHTFHLFLKQLVFRYAPRKIFVVVDNAPCHNLDEDGTRWLRQNRHLVELVRLPKYSPEFMPMEGVWKATRKRTTHNRFFETTTQRDAHLRLTFAHFQTNPSLIAAQVARYQ